MVLLRETIISSMNDSDYLNEVACKHWSISTVSWLS